MLQRLVKDPFSLALALTPPCLFIVYDGYDWEFGFAFTSRGIWEEYNYAALAIIWAVAIIRWKWQKEDRAKQG